MMYIEDILNQIIAEEQKQKEKLAKKNQTYNVNIKLNEKLTLKAIAYNGPVVIAYFSDGTCTKARSMTENYDAGAGIAVCITKKLIGEEVFYQVLKECDPTYKKKGPVKANAIAERKNEANRIEAKNTAKSENKAEDEDNLEEFFNDFISFVFGL